MKFGIKVIGAVLGLAMSALAGTALVASAQSFPTKPITILVGYNPGDNMDVMTRMLAKKVEENLGQPITIVNKPGVAGATALSVLKNEEPDGYTLASVVDTPLDRMMVVRKLDYTQDDFAPVMEFASGVTGIVVRSDAPWQTFEEFVNYAKENSGEATYATSGSGSTMHVAMQFIEHEGGFEWTHVPYPGARDTLAALLGGHIDAAVGSTQWAEDVKAGNMRLLAVIAEDRMSAFPEVPTIAEKGYDFTSHAISLLVAPDGTPPEVVDKLDNAFKQAMEDPEFKNLLKTLLLEHQYRGNEELTAFLAQVLEDYHGTVENLGIPTAFNQ